MRKYWDQAREADQIQARYVEQIAISERQLKRMDAVITEKERQVQRLDALLKKWEQQPNTKK